MVLVTGALGAIGSWVVRRLLDQQVPFVALDWRADFSLLPDLEGKFPFEQGDVLDEEWLRELARRHGVRRIAHLAALMPPACEDDPRRGYEVNFIGALNVFETARELELERVVFMSSKARYGAISGVHGPPAFEPIPEEYEGQTLDVYGSTKLVLEDAARHYRRLYGLDLITLRLGSTYGPGKLARHGAVGLKSRIVEMAVGGEPFAIPTPDHVDDVVYNRDVAKAITLACFAPKPGHWQFNVSGGKLISLRQFAEEVMRLCPRHRLSFDETATEPPTATAGLLSIARARSELGFEPDFPGVRGVADYLAHLESLPHG